MHRALDHLGPRCHIPSLDLNAVFDIDQRSGNILWKLGGSATPESLRITNDPVFTNGSHFGGQHDARLLPDGTVTLAFSDIEGSTILTEKLGDQRWMSLLREHNQVVRKQLRTHHGFEVKSEGDGFMLAFQSALHALRCAIAIQRDLAKRNEGAADPIRVRMGLHTGEVIKEANDFFGKNVILAARIAAQAVGGQILASSVVEAVAESSHEFNFKNPRELQLKGLAGTHSVVEVAW
jgi:class 3 adenylate cyclase